MRSTFGFAAVLALAATTAVLTDPARADSSTVRIEGRPFYGATVTLEEGVRVFRPLPPHSRVIINPNRTPLELYIEDRRSVSYNYGAPHVSGQVHVDPTGDVSPFYGRDRGRHSHHGGKVQGKTGGGVPSSPGRR